MSRTAFVLAGAVVALAAIALPASARADYVSGSGYACRVTYGPVQGGVILIGPSPGQFGTVSVSFYTQPYCAGTFVRSVVAYSTGSSVASYSNVQIYYGEPELMALWQNLERAASSGERLSFNAVTFTYGSFFTGTQLTYVSFGSF